MDSWRCFWTRYLDALAAELSREREERRRAADADDQTEPPRPDAEVAEER